MKIVVLASGSKGNATYIETDNTKILIDAGVSMLQMRNHLAKYNISLTNLDAVLVTHEHSDHIKYLTSILTKTHATLYIEEVTFDASMRKLRTSLECFPHAFIKPNDANKFYKYTIGDLSVVPLKLSHDTNSCIGFCIKDTTKEGNITYASITDTGILPERYYRLLGSIHTILLESNYDETMLLESDRSDELKMRIMSEHGHLCNDATDAHLASFVTNANKRIILGHISEECNTPELARDGVEKVYGGKVPFELYTAWQHEPLYFEVKDENHD